MAAFLQLTKESKQKTENSKRIGRELGLNPEEVAQSQAFFENYSKEGSVTQGKIDTWELR
jgi:hypothetical protein